MVDRPIYRLNRSSRDLNDRALDDTIKNNDKLINYSRAQRIDDLRDSQAHDIKERYFPKCEAGNVAKKFLSAVGTLFNGSFLLVQDSHLKDIEDQGKLDLVAARARACVNVIGKAILGLSIAATIPLSIVLGTVGAFFGALIGSVAFTDPTLTAGGAKVGCLIACAATAGLALLGATLIGLSEPGLTAKDKLTTILEGTLLPAKIVFSKTEAILGDSDIDDSEKKTLNQEEMQAYYWLHSFGKDE